MKKKGIVDFVGMNHGQLKGRYKRLCTAEARARKTGQDYELAEVSEEVDQLLEYAQAIGVNVEG